MSGAEKRNGERVYRAAVTCAMSKNAMTGNFVSVGEVAKEALMGKVTCRKYMDAMVEAGVMERFTVTPTIVIYRFI